MKCIVRTARRVLAAAPWLGMAAGVSACDDSQIVGPEVFGEVVEFAQEIPVAQLETVLGTSAVRLEIVLGEEGLVAREVEAKAPDALGEPEKIQSRVANLSVSDGGSVLTFELGDVAVGFDSETSLRNSEGHEMGFENFVAHINEALASDVPISVRAKRLPPDAPQHPDDAAFTAMELRLQNDAIERGIELNVDGDNFETNDAPPPDGWIRVLGLAIEVRASEGLTKIQHQRDDLQHADFEGMVASVNLDRHEFVLANHTVVKLIDISKIKFEDGDRHRLPSLAAVDEALRAGKKVFTAGEGVVEREDPLTIIASHVVFEVEIPVEDFWGLVESVSLDANSATLASGIVVRIDVHTKIRFEEGDRMRLPSLEAVAEALEAGEQVFAAGEGEVVLGADGTLTILAFHVVFERELAVENFAGPVASVDLNAHTATLGGGTVVRIDDRTKIKYEDSAERLLPSLAAVAEALELGQAVFAAGEGEVETASDGSVGILAFHVIFELEMPIEEFAGPVESVNLDNHTVTLENGVVVRVDDATKIRHEEGDAHTLASLTAVAEALTAGDAVFAAGYGEIVAESDGSVTILALHVVFELDIPIEEFEGQVETVNLGAGSFTLAGGIVVRITDHTDINLDGHLKTLGGVAEALAADRAVVAIGKGRVEAEGDAFVISASHVKFLIREAT